MQMDENMKREEDFPLQLPSASAQSLLTLMEMSGEENRSQVGKSTFFIPHPHCTCFPKVLKIETDPMWHRLD